MLRTAVLMFSAALSRDVNDSIPFPFVCVCGAAQTDIREALNFNAVFCELIGGNKPKLRQWKWMSASYKWCVPDAHKRGNMLFHSYMECITVCVLEFSFHIRMYRNIYKSYFWFSI